MLQNTSPHSKIELDAAQQLALVNVYRLLIHLAENPGGEEPYLNRTVGDEIQMKGLILRERELFNEEVSP